MPQFQTPRGTRDLAPDEMRRRNWIIQTVRTVYERYGFEPLETPAFEDWALLSAKGGGGDAIRDEIYYFKDKSGRELGLRFDLTVPLARFIASNPQLPKPFKRYQIGKVWRYDNPQAGRFREFWQADIDTVGSSSPEADAECLAAAAKALEALGFKDFRIRVNDRRILSGLARKLNLQPVEAAVFRVLDKMGKVGEAETAKQLKSIDAKAVKMLDAIRAGFPKLGKDAEGAEELGALLKACEAYHLKVEPDLSLVRGLDYYTGGIFEIEAGAGIGSIAGGGRYDKLIGSFGGQDLPAVGISIGIDRVAELLRSMGAARKEVFVVAVKPELRNEAVRLATELRSAGIQAVVDVAGKDLRKQLDYVNSNAIPFALFVGPAEVKEGRFTLRDMKTGKEKKLAPKELAKALNA